MDKKLYKFGMDWLNGVLPVEDVVEVFKMLEMFSGKLRFDRWQLTNSGKYNYRRRFCLDGNMSIQLMYNPVSDEELFTADKNHNNSGVFFSISGDGIRYLHTLGGEVSALNKLLFYFYRHGFKSSRFDVYCDILDENNEIVPLITDAFSRVGRETVGFPFVKCRLRRNNNNYKQIPVFDSNGNTWFNSQLGHHGSNVGMFRCYNKHIEMSEGRLKDISEDVFNSYDVDSYWYRLEYEMHKENAAACFNALMEKAENCNSPLCFEDIFFSVFNHVFCIGVANTTFQFTNGCHKVPDAWSSFADEFCSNNEYFVQFGSVPYVKASLHRLDKNMDRISSYVYIILMRLFSMAPSERQSYIVQASDKFMKNKKYNSIRDEFDELSADNPFIMDSLANFAEYAEIA